MSSQPLKPFPPDAPEVASPTTGASGISFLPPVGGRAKRRWYRQPLGLLGLCAALAYLVWNMYWLVHGQVPPAIFKALTGYPAPTTGGTRAIRFLIHGEIRESLACNAMAVPFLLLFSLSLLVPFWQWLRGRRIALPRAVCWAWALALGLGWLLKLFGDPKYW